MKIRLDILLLITGVLISTILYYSFPSDTVWEKDGVYYDPDTGKKVEEINPKNLVHVGGFVNGDSYEVYKVFRPVNWVPYFLFAFTFLSFVVIHVYSRATAWKIPILHG